jgi:hypothetical protein
LLTIPPSPGATQCLQAAGSCHETGCPEKPRRRHGGPDILALLVADCFETMARYNSKTRRVTRASI